MWDLLSRLCEFMLPIKSRSPAALRRGAAQRAEEMAATSRVTSIVERVAPVSKIADTPESGGAAPVGIAFTLPELMILTAWAEFHEVRVVLELDNCIDGAEYEEVAALYFPDSPLRQWTLWRAPDAVVVEPLNGPAFRADCIAELLQGLMSPA